MPRASSVRRSDRPRKPVQLRGSETLSLCTAYISAVTSNVRYEREDIGKALRTDVGFDNAIAFLDELPFLRRVRIAERNEVSKFRLVRDGVVIRQQVEDFRHELAGDALVLAD